MFFSLDTNGPFIGRIQLPGGPWPRCLALILTLIGCLQPTTHHHVAVEGKPESLEQMPPTWVEEFALSVSEEIGDDELLTGLQPNRRPHVLLISLDTLRADHLGAWGYDRPTSPFLDALARNGVRFQSV